MYIISLIKQPCDSRMIKFELLPSLTLQKQNVHLRSQKLPELVHLDDPALAVMTDFSQAAPRTINPEDTMDDALNEMKATGVHLLLVVDKEGCIQGIISSEDILGEKPIQLLQERRISRAQILVKMISAPLEQITAFDIEAIEHARVGNVVNTLKKQHQHYALVVRRIDDSDEHIVRGLFNTSQIGKQLHMDIANSVTKAQSLSELQKRHSD